MVVAAGRADLDHFDRILANAGIKPPRPGDEPRAPIEPAWSGEPTS